MRKRRGLLLVACSILSPLSVSAAAPESAFILTTKTYADETLVPAYVGNGYLGARVPFDGQGYQDNVSSTQVQGLFASGRLHWWMPRVERRASLPDWTALSYDDGSGAFALAAGSVSDYRQSLDLRTGTVTTDVHWTSPAGRAVDLRYDVFTDRANPHAAIVRLRLTPHFAGTVTVGDTQSPATGKLLHGVAAGVTHGTQYIDIATEGLSVAATVASVLVPPTNGTVETHLSRDGKSTTAQVHIEVKDGQTYEIVKVIGVAVATDQDATGTPHDRALAAAAREATLGYENAQAQSKTAWDRVWASDIEIDGDTTVQTATRMALYALFASARDDMAWAPSPAGLSGEAYMGHVFWDSDTWMLPVYLATAPTIAKQLLQYRLDRVGAARAVSHGPGARYPWESALSGAEAVPIPIFGKELHISSDVALAAWQYWLATDDRDWLTRAFPMLSGIADFWAAHATPNTDGSRSIRQIVPPDEDVLTSGKLGWYGVLADMGPLVDDNAFTNGAAQTSLQIAARAANILSLPANAAWTETAKTLRVGTARTDGVIPEYAGYADGPIRQADTMLLAYPWERMDSNAANANMAFYGPRTNPDAPAMTDSIHAIVASHIGGPGCGAYSFTRRSIDPFLRAPYSQVGEFRRGGSPTFLTGAGGLVQEFIYGYAGLRWRDDALWLDPFLPPQLERISLNAIHWRGRVLKVDVRAEGTRVMLLSGDPMNIAGPDGVIVLSMSAPVTVKTRQSTDLAGGGNIALCQRAKASPSSKYAAAAVNDGADTTTWLGESPDDTVTVDLGRDVAVQSIAIARPPVVAIVRRSSRGPEFDAPYLMRSEEGAPEVIETSIDGETWMPLVHDDAAVTQWLRARYIRVSAPEATALRPLVVGEIVVTERP